MFVTGAEGTDPRQAALKRQKEKGFVLLLIKSEKLTLEEVFLKVTENAEIEETEETKKQKQMKKILPAAKKNLRKQKKIMFRNKGGKIMAAIFKREMKMYFSSMIGYVFTAFFVLVTAIYFHYKIFYL